MHEQEKFENLRSQSIIDSFFKIRQKYHSVTADNICVLTFQAFFPWHFCECHAA